MTDKEALEKSVKHWKIMIRWAEKQEPNKKINPYTMFDDLNQAWGAHYCALCKKYVYRFCEGCPLDIIGQNCNFDHSIYCFLQRSKNWEEWIKHANNLLECLQNILKEYE